MEVVGGFALATGSAFAEAPTLGVSTLGLVGGSLMIAHGMDNMMTAARTAATGKPQQTSTYQFAYGTAEQLGSNEPKRWAEAVDFGMPLFAAAIATTPTRLGAGRGATHPTFEPGPYAGESIPARSPSQVFTPAERAEINRIGQTTGCHTCGATNPGTKSGNFVPDHQPVSSLSPPNTPQRLYPQCIDCSKEQGLEAARQLRGR